MNVCTNLKYALISNQIVCTYVYVYVVFVYMYVLQCLYIIFGLRAIYDLQTSPGR